MTLIELSQTYVHFIVIGYYYNTTRKFKHIYKDPFYALSINLWRGRVYGVLPNTKRKLIKTVVN